MVRSNFTQGEVQHYVIKFVGDFRWFCVYVLWIGVCPLPRFLLAIVLSVLLWCTGFHCLFGIFKLLLLFLMVRSNFTQGEVQHCVIKFVGDFRWVSGFLRVLRSIDRLYFGTVQTVWYFLFLFLLIIYISRWNFNIFEEDIFPTQNSVCIIYSKQAGIILLTWKIAIHNMLCYPLSCIPLYNIIYVMY
jgi:hypothetical protein